MSEITQPIPARLRNVAVNGHVAGAADIIDDNLNKTQAEINAEIDEVLGDGGNVAFIDDEGSSPAVVPSFDPESQSVHITSQVLSEQQKAQVRTNIGLNDVDARISNAVNGVENEMNTKFQQYDTAIGALNGSDTVVGALPQSGETNKVYRVPNDPTTNKYTDYGWDGTQFVKLSTYPNDVDNVPTAWSDNLVKSGGIIDGYFPFVKTNNNSWNAAIIKTSVLFKNGGGVYISPDAVSRNGYVSYLFFWTPDSHQLMIWAYKDETNYDRYSAIVSLGFNELVCDNTTDKIYAYITNYATQSSSGYANLEPTKIALLYGKDCLIEALLENKIENIDLSDYATLEDIAPFAEMVEEGADLDDGTKTLSFIPDRTKATVLAFNDSTFSGHGEYIGNVGIFRYLVTKIHCSEWVEHPESVTQVLVQFRQNTYNGTLLKEKLFDIDNITPGNTSQVILDFGENVSLSGNIYMAIRLNSFGVLYKVNNGSTYPYEEEGTPYATYWTDGNISSSNTGSVTSGKYNASLYWELFSVLDVHTRLTDEQVEDIGNRLGVLGGLDISLPDKLYAVVGDTLQLFFRGMIKAVNPYNYDILITCAKGKQYPRYFEYTPSAADVGTASFKVSVKDNNRNIIAEKTCQLVTCAKGTSPASNKNIAIFGDSLTESGAWPVELNRRLKGSGGSPEGDSKTNITFCGKKTVDGVGFFGRGGFAWSHFTSAYIPAFRLVVSGVSEGITVGAHYTDGTHDFHVMEVNITEGVGTVLMFGYDTPTSASGTMTKTSGTGANSIAYSSYTEEGQNPLWDYTNNKMSFIPYANEFCDGQLDVVYTLLSWNSITNGQKDFTTVMGQVKQFADTLHSEYPNAKLKLMGLQINSINGGMGADYGATGTGYADTYGMVVSALNLNKAYQDFANNPDYNGFVEFVNVSAEFDSEYNMQYIKKPANTRISFRLFNQGQFNAVGDFITYNDQTYIVVESFSGNWDLTKVHPCDPYESIGTNGVHPSNAGYMQIADIAYRDIIATLCQ